MVRKFPDMSPKLAKELAAIRIRGYREHLRELANEPSLDHLVALATKDMAVFARDTATIERSAYGIMERVRIRRQAKRAA